MAYSKSWHSFDQQLDVLIGRGMQVSDRMLVRRKDGRRNGNEGNKKPLSNLPAEAV